MSTSAAVRAFTPADLLALPDRNRYELVDGELVELNVSALSSLVASRLNRELGNFCEATSLAWVFGADCGYQCFPDSPGKVRKPDVSAVRRERLPVEALEEGYVAIAPDLAVEVISPHDLAYEVDRKVEEYLGAGVRLVWVINPELRTVRVHRRDGSVGLLREADGLDGEDVLPGFACPIRGLFPAPTAAVAPPAAAGAAAPARSP